ncbi:MAG: peptide deformylase [Acholeplasmatales bacterium]|jgi:peptide deformylase|nr:peptide deformylase [Acholeplasmataceae bacterium]MCK9289041.1 peptide deformylase [Acholeplasmataceae bacterium]MCK9427736.1 peptide deformylase [Acholeplasmataceae bacterium]MDY0115521.1 peptide deformylase [Acholeplasmatales bacterium]
MILMKDIIREGHPNLTKKSKKISLPASKKDQELGVSLLTYCIVSQNEELNELYQLRPGVGLSAVQINVLKRIFAMHLYDFDGTLYSYIISNPVITYKSKELIYLNGGEGCLSVDRETEGITPRHKVIKAQAFVYDLNEKRFKPRELTLKGLPAIVFQHEYDHLEGILYVSKLFDELPDAKPLIEKETHENSP